MDVCQMRNLGCPPRILDHLHSMDPLCLLMVGAVASQAYTPVRRRPFRMCHSQYHDILNKYLARSGLCVLLARDTRQVIISALASSTPGTRANTPPGAPEKQGSKGSPLPSRKYRTDGDGTTEPLPRCVRQSGPRCGFDTGRHSMPCDRTSTISRALGEGVEIRVK